MIFKDYYRILGINPGSSQGEVKEAWRRMASAYHPDKHPESNADSAHFLEIKEAYDVLGSTVGRREYDKLYRQNITGSEMTEPQITSRPQYNTGSTYSFEDDIIDWFYRIFKQENPSGRNPGNPNHIHYDDLI